MKFHSRKVLEQAQQQNMINSTQKYFFKVGKFGSEYRWNSMFYLVGQDSIYFWTNFVLLKLKHLTIGTYDLSNSRRDWNTFRTCPMTFCMLLHQIDEALPWISNGLTLDHSFVLKRIWKWIVFLCIKLCRVPSIYLLPWNFQITTWLENGSEKSNHSAWSKSSNSEKHHTIQTTKAISTSFFNNL